MKTIRIWTTLLGILGLIATISVQASSITASNGCPSGAGCDGSGDEYGFLWTVSTTADPLILSSSVQNTAPAGSAPLIDQVFFNLNPTQTLGTHFFVDNINPADWAFSAASGGVLFDYIGDEQPGLPDDRIAAQGSLTFDLRFIAGVLPTPPLDIFLTADQSSGAGAGGGTDMGQVAVSFQALTTGEGSDLLAANWSSSSTSGNGSGPGGGVPEPNIMALLGISMLGVLVFRQRRKS